ncbi:hypothetical protein BJP40_06415 [Streptomyces sp. CC53]|uniref:hypothetical protein n=1 Tax=Streptomyces sp. CC53 TaxID=1906740 RepID=UPI0008DD0632|nr:hypothetical protein [Streptomyces sp. CC53]OII61156.1 hypothetical protein BJP40_06415 [Streptomyces sp. CC53]
MRKVLNGRRIRDLALPGDDDGVLDYLIRQAVRRDGRFSALERIVYGCTAFQLQHGLDFCMMIDCPNCGGL